MARRPRLLLAGYPLHVVQRSHYRQPCFFAHADYVVYLDWLREYSTFYGVAIHAYVLMTNHVHFLVSAAEVPSISMFMKGISQKYAQYLNRRFERKGTWWEGRFRSSPVPVEQYFMTCQRYIELNPVRAEMTGTADAYPWSSFAGNTGTKNDPLLTPHGLYLSLGQETCERHVNYRALFGTPIPTAQIDAIRQALARNHPIGMPPPPKERKCARM